MSAEGNSANSVSTAPVILQDRYEIGERLADGTFFYTHRGRDIQTGQPVAIKVLKPEYAADEEFAANIHSEAQRASHLHHPNIARVFEAWRERGTVVITTEWVRGINLKDRIRRVAPFPLAVAIDIVNACAQALNYAAQQGFVHGDIRPDNVIITPDGRVKITDFGVGSSISASSRIQMTALPRAAYYLAPELAEGRAADGRSDLYSLGCILFEMLAGAVPFDADTPLAAAVKHLNDPVPSLQKRNPSVPNAVDGIAAKCMQKDPNARYATPHDLLRDIQSVREAIRNDEPLDWSPMRSRTEAEPLPETKKKPRAAKPQPKPRPEPPPPAADTGPSIRLLLGVALLLIGMIAGFFGLVSHLLSTTDETKVPAVLKMNRADAATLLDKFGLKAKIQEEYHESIPEGSVFRTDPAVDTGIKKGRTITLFVSKGPEPVKVPGVVGKKIDAAVREIEAAGLVVGDKRSEFSEYTDAGEVISQSPSSGADARKKSKVSLVVSKGPEPTPDADTEPTTPPDTGTTPGTNGSDSGGTLDQDTRPADGAENPDLPTRGNDVVFDIPSRASGPQRVRIVVRHEDGKEETVYDQERDPGETVKERVTTRAHEGKAQIRVYLNDRQIYSEQGPPFP